MKVYVSFRNKMNVFDTYMIRTTQLLTTCSGCNECTKNKLLNLGCVFRTPIGCTDSGGPMEVL